MAMLKYKPATAGSPKFQPGDTVLVTARVIHEDEDGLVEVSILDGTLPKVVDCFIWATSLQRPIAKKRGGKT